MNNSSFTRTDAAALAFVLTLLSCLLFPALAQSNTTANQSKCLNNLKQLSIAIMNFHDTRKCLPLASSQTIEHKPGSADADTGAGFSWLAGLLPFVEQRNVAERIFKAQKDNQPAFGSESNVAGTVLNSFICPDYKSDTRVSADDSDYVALKGGALPAISNYHCFAGSHFFNADGLGRMVPPDKLAEGSFAYEGDGALPFPGMVGDKLQKTGLRIQSLSDGTSNTFTIAETIEPAYAAWIDGQSTWLVAAWPGNAKPLMPQASDTNPEQPILSWSDEDKKTAKVAVNLRYLAGRPKAYLAVGRWSGSKQRVYAATSNHPGVVGHAYADGHVEMISPDIDPNVYVHLVTRNGREIISDEFRNEQTTKPPRSRPQPRSTSSPTASSGIAAVELVADQWRSDIDWSPLAVGDVRLRFPQVLSPEGFRPDPTDHNRLICPIRSSVFEAIVFDREKSEILLYVREKESPTAAGPLFKQLRTVLGEPAAKEVDKKPKRVIWRKNAKWSDGAAALEFTLTEQSDDAAANLSIRATPVK